MVEKKEWNEFRESGLLLFINQILHVFGWSIVFQINEKGEVTDVYPARVKFRGFDHNAVGESYKNISEYMVKESEQLLKEASE